MILIGYEAENFSSSPETDSVTIFSTKISSETGFSSLD